LTLEEHKLLRKFSDGKVKSLGYPYLVALEEQLYDENGVVIGQSDAVLEMAEANSSWSR